MKKKGKIKQYGLKQALKDNLELSDKMLRWLSLTISRVLAKYTSTTPNQVTIFSFILTLIAGYLFLRGDYNSLVIGGVLAFLRQIFDQVDGEIARMKGLTSDLGKWLDNVTGFIGTEVLIICLAIGINTKLALTLGMLAAIAYPMQYLLVYSYKYEIVREFKPIKISKSKRFDFLRYAYGSALFYILLPLGVFINRPLWVLGFFAVFGNVFWVGTILIQFLNTRAKKH